MAVAFHCIMQDHSFEMGFQTFLLLGVDFVFIVIDDFF